MTKDQYFEMCEALGSTPKDSEIPIDYEDLVDEVKDALRIYSNLQDNWDYFNGNYMGKNLVGLKDIFDLYDIDPRTRQPIFEYIQIIDRLRSKSIQDKKPKK